MHPANHAVHECLISQGAVRLHKAYRQASVPSEAAVQGLSCVIVAGILVAVQTRRRGCLLLAQIASKHSLMVKGGPLAVLSTALSHIH